MKILSLFNNKGGVGKTTLAFHLSHALAEMNYKILMIDLDPQCNLTICGMDEENLHSIWEDEDDLIEDFEVTKNKIGGKKFDQLISNTRTIHFLLKPAEEGTGELNKIPPPLNLKKNLDLIPGRLTIHKYENKIAERWSGAYQGDPLSIRTITKIRNLAIEYSKLNNYDFVLIDTSPSLSALNKVIISTVDGFIIPCLPDMFSLYGIRNIGNALISWKKEFDTIFSLISDEKRKSFSSNFVRFLGYTIYNAKRYKGATQWNLAKAHYNYAQQIPITIKTYIKEEVRNHLDSEMVSTPIGEQAVMHSHSTLPNMSQKYKKPIWEIPGLSCLEKEDKGTIFGNREVYVQTRVNYIDFANDLLKRIETLD